MEVIPVEANSDNYMYLIVDNATKECAVVDPAEPKKIVEKCQQLGLKLTKILTTHHHWDHADGNPLMVKSLPAPVPVYGGDDRIPSLTNKVSHQDMFQIGSLNVKCLFTPCHTTGHICYFVTTSNDQHPPAVFTGDTLFLSGCGRFFEGTAEQMYTALVEILAKLPSETKVYCGHEYSVANLKFSLHVEPNNEQTKAKLAWAIEQRNQNKPTVPYTIEEERLYNPFMRVDQDSIKTRYGVADGIQCMQALRKEKDSWKST